MELFEKIEKEKYSWTLFYYLQNANYNDDKQIIYSEFENGVKVEREVVSGIGLELVDWNKRFDFCKSLQVFSSELEMSLLCMDREINYYSSKGGLLDIKDIDVIGNYIYITETEICTPIVLENSAYTDNTYFLNFKEYYFDSHTDVKGIVCDYQNEIFSIFLNDINGNRCIYKMSGVKKSLTYPFVLFILKNLPRGEMAQQRSFNVEKIKRKEF